MKKEKLLVVNDRDRKNALWNISGGSNGEKLTIQTVSSCYNQILCNNCATAYCIGSHDTFFESQPDIEPSVANRVVPVNHSF